MISPYNLHVDCQVSALCASAYIISPYEHTFYRNIEAGSVRTTPHTMKATLRAHTRVYTQVTQTFYEARIYAGKRRNELLLETSDPLEKGAGHLG